MSIGRGEPIGSRRQRLLTNSDQVSSDFHSPNLLLMWSNNSEIRIASTFEVGDLQRRESKHQSHSRMRQWEALFFHRHWRTGVERVAYCWSLLLTVSIFRLAHVRWHCSVACGVTSRRRLFLYLSCVRSNEWMDGCVSEWTSENSDRDMFVQFADSSARAQYFIRRRVFHIIMETTSTQRKFPLRLSARVT